MCPRKCFNCSKQTVCYNDGIYSSAANKCMCKLGFQGSNCEIVEDKCAVDDRPECALLNCDADPADYYLRCIRKCRCCSNKNCPKTGLLLKTDSDNNPCTCQCEDSRFDPDTECKTLKPNEACVDESGCGSQYPESLCFEQNELGEFVRNTCPKMCKICS